MGVTRERSGVNLRLSATGGRLSSTMAKVEDSIESCNGIETTKMDQTEGNLPKELHEAVIKEFGMTKNRSDMLGLRQLCFHIACVLTCTAMVNAGRQSSWALLH